MEAKNLQIVEFNGYKILCGGARIIRNEIVNRIKNGEKLFVVTLNSQIYLRAQENREYDFAIKNATFHLPDGAGIVWAIKKWCNVKTDRVPGIETMQFLCELSKEFGWSVYLLGSTPEIVERAARNLINVGVNVIGWHHGFFNGDGPVEEIRAKKPDLLFVGMGVPKQELWIHSHLELPFKLAMGVGGSIDVVAGVKKRAPLIFQKLRLEWFYRWLKEPRKRWKVPFDVLKFYFKVIVDGNKRKARTCSKVSG
ncbi:WecB/TagA/CpsF family glycosyltransferase [Fervidobacterium thailandense]|uniref:WecB/TagA/CpsF family glycosyltransferase n=1 Tax=Fervidobacterium thailandense TaxID=1008305 RepID=UPI00355B6A86